MLQNKFKVAKATFKRALTISENKFGKEHPYTADIVYELGCFYLMKPEEESGQVDSTKGKSFLDFIIFKK
jgi:hypothetical protein